MRVDEVKVARPWDFDEAVGLECLAHGKRHAVILGAVDQRDRNGCRGQRAGVGDGITLWDLIGPAAHQLDCRPGT